LEREEKEMADRDAINDILADYAWANDAKDEGILKRIFAEDATFSLEIAGVEDKIGPFEGRDAIVDFIYPTVRDQTDQRRHAIVNTRFVEDEDDRARVRAYLLLNVIDGGTLDVKSAGVYDVDFARGGNGWEIKSMHLSLDAPF
jgi:3-phenylpropionate/cinnamic acid dioxygenase small subunit